MSRVLRGIHRKFLSMIAGEGGQGGKDELLHGAGGYLTERKRVGVGVRWRGFNGLPSNADGAGLRFVLGIDKRMNDS
jgi:hypothetical protein